MTQTYDKRDDVPNMDVSNAALSSDPDYLRLINERMNAKVEAATRDVRDSLRAAIEESLSEVNDVIDAMRDKNNNLIARMNDLNERLVSMGASLDDTVRARVEEALGPVSVAVREQIDRALARIPRRKKFLGIF